MSNLGLCKFLMTSLAASMIGPAFAQSECSPKLGNNMNHFAASNCDVIDKMNSCAQRTVDPDAIKKQIEELFAKAKIAETEFEKENGDDKAWQKYKNTDLAQLFHAWENNQSSVSKYHVRSLYNFIAYPGRDSSNPYPIAEEDFQQAIIKNYVAYAKKFNCTPVIEHSASILETYPKNYKVDISPNGASRSQLESNFRKEMNAAALVEKKNEYFKQLNAKFEETGVICHPNQLQVGPYTTVAVEFPPCAGNVAQNFSDNSWTTGRVDFSDSSNSELSNCVKNSLSRGAKIANISIVASASALNNTAEAAKLFCKKGFAGLSQKRAEMARDEILPQIFQQAGATDSNYLSKVELDFAGSNKDGTSGPCPYELVNGKEHLKSEYQTAEGRKSLDKEKYVKVHISFEKTIKATKESTTYFEANYPCRRVKFSCKR